MNYIEQLGEKALEAKRKIATASTGEKNKVLEAIAQVLLENSDAILAENEKDIANARDNGISETMVDRLRLTKERIKGIADACMELVNLEDPVGEVLQGSVRPNGMRITKVRVPMGVIGIIYESRPNVTVDAGALCLKSGNAAILRGGKEAIHSNMILVNLMQRALETSGFAKETIQLVEDTSREVPQGAGSDTRRGRGQRPAGATRQCRGAGKGTAPGPEGNHRRDDPPAQKMHGTHAHRPDGSLRRQHATDRPRPRGRRYAIHPGALIFPCRKDKTGLFF